MVLGLWDFLFLGSRETLIQSQNQCFLKNGLSEIMRTGSKDLSAAEFLT